MVVKTMDWEKKMHVKVVGSISFGVNEDYSPEDSLSDNSEKLLH